MGKPVIICVDDEKIIVDSLKAEIKNAFSELLTIETAESAAEALEIIEEYIAQKIDIPIVVSDWLMPEMKGDEFLIRVHQLLPDTKKIMLTGQATTSGLGNAINNAKLYRFIPKPWSADDFDLTITEAFKSYYNKIQLNAANAKLSDLNALLEAKVKARTLELEESNNKNHILLDQTLSGSVNAMIKILMRSNPGIFNKAFRMRNYTKRIVKHLDLKNTWEIEIACLFSQMGCLDLPELIVKKIEKGEKLSQQELNTFRLHPQKTYELINGIPILGNIANGILNHLKATNLLVKDGSYQISAILRICSDLDDYMLSGLNETVSVDMIRKNKNQYDEQIVNILIQEIDQHKFRNKNILRLGIKELKVGYVFAQDVIDTDHNVIFLEDEEITKTVLMDIIQIAKRKDIIEPIFVYNYFLI